MAVSEEFRLFVLDQLAQVTPVRARRMFGGVGFWADALFFAVADDDTLYLKTDAVTKPLFEAEGMGPFRPFGPDSPPMAYHELPPRALEDVDELRRWVNDAIGVAARARSSTSAPRPSRGRRPRPSA